MPRMRTLPASLALSLFSATVAADEVRNWTAPPSWKSPTAERLENLVKSEKFRPFEVLGVDELPTGPLPLFGIAPCRIADTRGNGFTGQAGGPALVANATRTFQITGVVAGVPSQCGIPATAQAVSFQFTIVQPSSAGNLIAWPSGPPPTTSVLNWSAGEFALGNGIAVPVSTSGALNVFMNAPGGATAHLTIDVNGYYAPAGTAGAKTVAVDCTLGQKIQAAIDREDGPLVVDVHGICEENVNIVRKNVTLRGVDPNTDGIDGAPSNPQFAALRYRFVEFAEVQNLTIRNGPTVGVNVAFSSVFFENSRVTGHGQSGFVIAQGTFIDASGTLISNNLGAGVNVQTASRFFCHGCDITNNGGFAAVVGTGSVLSYLNSIVTGQRGFQSSGHSYVDIDCVTEKSVHPCGLTATGRAALAFLGGTVAFFGAGDFSGQVSAGDAGTVHLLGARQLATGQPGLGPVANDVSGFGKLVAGDLDDLHSQLFGTTSVSRFGRLLLLDNSTLAGPIQCSSAGDAWIDPTVVEGPGAAVTGCEHGTLPP
jgi:hypothetical protein